MEDNQYRIKPKWKTSKMKFDQNEHDQIICAEFLVIQVKVFCEVKVLALFQVFF